MGFIKVGDEILNEFYEKNYRKNCIIIICFCTFEGILFIIFS